MGLLMHRAVFAVMLLAIPVAAPAEMSVGTFLVKADALKKKGILALLSSDMGVLKKEMRVVMLAYRDDTTGARAAGRKPHSCPPEKASMSSDDLMAHLRTLPGSTSLKTGFYSMMKKRYPCPA
jgi:hypothetical protein